MRKIEILDCTLRDGGYINNWYFGENNIKKIINGLTDAKIDYVECGFLDNTINEYDLDYSIFTDIIEAEKVISNIGKTRYMVMMLLHKYYIDGLPICLNNKVNIIRLAFHKSDFDKMIDYAKKIKNKGYKLFLQPTIIMSYTNQEIIEMINKCNNIIKPDGIAIVDTLGEMYTNDIKKLSKIFDKYLDNNITMLFHGHNNRQMAFSNAITFIQNVNEKRNIIVDTSLMGMGKDSGNVCTELMSDYLNQYFNASYNYNKIISIINDCINTYKKKFDWGYNPVYMLNAKNRIHPSYGKYFRNNIKDLTIMDLNCILGKVPLNERNNFNKQLANTIVNQFELEGKRYEDSCNYTNEIK